jgi:ATP synthase protein I
MTPRFGAKRVLMTQAIIAAVATIGFYVLSDFTAVTKSSALGGLIAFIPSAYYVWRSSRLLNPGEAAEILKANYKAEAGKLGLTAVLFGVAFTQFGPIAAVPLFTTYILTLLSYWVALLLVR